MENYTGWTFLLISVSCIVTVQVTQVLTFLWDYIHGVKREGSVRMHCITSFPDLFPVVGHSYFDTVIQYARKIA